jgi:hypothetical protein
MVVDIQGIGTSCSKTTKKRDVPSSRKRTRTNKKKYALGNICDGNSACHRDETWFHVQSMIDDIVHN